MSTTPVAFVESERMSDRSRVYYFVRIEVGNGTEVKLDCLTEQGATELARLINEEVSDVEVML